MNDQPASRNAEHLWSRITQRDTLDTFLRQNHVPPRKALGQNFLVDPAVLCAVADDVLDGDGPLVEIGPGLGALTYLVVSNTERPVLLVEPDKRMQKVLQKLLGEYTTWELLQGAFNDTHVQTRLHDLGSFEAYGNLPYHAVKPVIRSVLDAPCTRAVLGMQREVALRIAARPGESNYGALSAIVQNRAAVRPTLHAPPESFYPQPKVHAVWLEITPHRKQTRPELRADTEHLIHACFHSRRKKLANSVNLRDLHISKEAWLHLLETTGISPDIRPQGVSPQEYQQLSEALHAL